MLDDLKEKIAKLSAAAKALRREADLANDNIIRARMLALLVVVLKSKNELVVAKINYLKAELRDAQIAARLNAIEAKLLIHKVRSHKR